MSARLARLALALYPLAYRRRYGKEIEALVEDQGASPRTVADLLRGAARAHLRPEPGLARELGPDDRLKLGVSTVLVGWVVFALAGLTLYKTTEGETFSSAGDAHGLLGTAHLAIQFLAVGVSAAVVLGAAPLVLAALRQAHDRREVRRASILAAGCVGVFGLATAALVIVAHHGGGSSDALDAVILALWTGVALACGIGCALAARRGLFALDVPGDALRRTRAWATLTALGMVGIALATAVYLGALLQDAPGLAGQGNGPLELLSVGASLGVALAVMVAACVPVLASVSRLRSGTRGR